MSDKGEKKLLERYEEKLNEYSNDFFLKRVVTAWMIFIEENEFVDFDIFLSVIKDLPLIETLYVLSDCYDTLKMRIKNKSQEEQSIARDLEIDVLKYKLKDYGDATREIGEFIEKYKK